MTRLGGGDSLSCYANDLKAPVFPQETASVITEPKAVAIRREQLKLRLESVLSARAFRTSTADTRYQTCQAMTHFSEITAKSDSCSCHDIFCTALPLPPSYPCAAPHPLRSLLHTLLFCLGIETRVLLRRSPQMRNSEYHSSTSHPPSLSPVDELAGTAREGLT